jgi:DNA repair protein RadC
MGLHVNSPSRVYEFAKEKGFHKSTVEQVYILAMNAKGHLIGYTVAARGSLNCCILDMRNVFQFLFGVNAASTVCVHNHPSGDVSPSEIDLEFANRLLDAGRLLSIDVNDFMIIGDGVYKSFRAEGILWEKPTKSTK